MEIKSIAENINILGSFCGKRDIDELNHGELKSKYNINKADVNGYGPKGKKFIAHVDIPDCVENAFEELMKVYGGDIREANPLYASK